MLTLDLELTPKTEKKLKEVFSAYESKEILAQNFINFQRSELKKAIEEITKDLSDFEKKYKISTEDFYKKYDEGKVEDKEDFMIWAGLFEMLTENKKKLDVLND